MMFYYHIEKIRPRPGGPDQYFCSGCGLVDKVADEAVEKVFGKVAEVFLTGG